LLLKIYHHHPFEPEFFLLLRLPAASTIVRCVVANTPPGAVEAGVAWLEVKTRSF